MKTNKNIRMIQGVILHPLKSLLFKIGKERKHYQIILGNRARYRQDERERERKIYISSITNNCAI